MTITSGNSRQDGLFVSLQMWAFKELNLTLGLPTDIAARGQYFLSIESPRAGYQFIIVDKTVTLYRTSLLRRITNLRPLYCFSGSITGERNANGHLLVAGKITIRPYEKIFTIVWFALIGLIMIFSILFAAIVIGDDILFPQAAFPKYNLLQLALMPAVCVLLLLFGFCLLRFMQILAEYERVKLIDFCTSTNAQYHKPIDDQN